MDPKTITPEHLGNDATDADVALFDLLLEFVDGDQDLTAQEAHEKVWNDGDYLGFAIMCIEDAEAHGNNEAAAAIQTAMDRADAEAA